MLSVKVPLKQGENARRQLSDAGVLSKDFEIKAIGKFLYLPVTSREFKLPFHFEITNASFKSSSRRPSLEEALLKKGFAQSQLEHVIRSFDAIGDVAIIEIPKALAKHKKTVAKAVLESNPRYRVVALKKGALKGKYRTRTLELLAGKNTETAYRESGCTFNLDPAKVYFSPRLSFERERIANLVKPGERVLVLFAGVGPYAIIIAKKQPRAIVSAVELNPVAVDYLKQNIAINKVVVEAVEGDVKKVVPKKFKAWADRILMPLPHTGEDFLPTALLAAKKDCIIHFYGFAPTRDEKTKRELDPLKPVEGIAKSACNKAKRKCSIVSSRIVRPYAPYVVQVAVDFKAH